MPRKTPTLNQLTNAQLDRARIDNPDPKRSQAEASGVPTRLPAGSPIGIDPEHTRTLAALAEMERQARIRDERTTFPDDGRFSLAELRAAFDLIADPDNWKNPIEARINPCFLDVCNRASIWFAGCGLTVVAVDAKTGRLHVHARGYYRAIGA